MSFTILQWNIMYGEDITRIAAFIAELAPDVVCLQELTRGYHIGAPDTGRYLTEALSYHGQYTYGPMALPSGGQTLMGNGIFSRFPIQSGRQLVLQAGRTERGRVVADERRYLEVTVQLPDGTVTVATTHLPFHPRLRTTAAKQMMVGQILAAAAVVPGPYILAGDFNSGPGSKAARALRRSLQHAGPTLNHKTWTTKPFRVGPYGFDQLDWRLDYVLYRGPLQPLGAGLVQTTLSDHLPLMVEFGLH